MISIGQLVLSDPQVLDKTFSTQWKIIKGVLIHQTTLKIITEIILVTDTKYKKYSKYQRSKSRQINSNKFINASSSYRTLPLSSEREKVCVSHWHLSLCQVLFIQTVHFWSSKCWKEWQLPVLSSVIVSIVSYGHCKNFFQYIVSTLHAPRSAAEADKIWPKPVARRSG